MTPSCFPKGITVLSICAAVLTACDTGLSNTSSAGTAHATTLIAQVIPATGPLKVHPSNSRYFTDASGRAVVLAGSHTWDNRQDLGTAVFDFTRYLTLLEQYNHNFARFWVWEQAKGITTWPDPAKPMATLTPELFARTGPGTAADGGLKFDVTKFNHAHFDRLRQRVLDARKRGIYMSIMLFDGWSIEKKSGGANPWTYHPFNRDNNINGVDGDLNGDDRGSETHTLQVPAITRLQVAYVQKVIETVNDLDNVLYEISNESNADSVSWQYYMIDLIKSHERAKTKQHPVGMTVPSPNGSNLALFNSAADWISPNSNGGYTDNPPASTGQKVIVADTDHLWGIGGDRQWAWKSFTRGLNLLYMDPWDGEFIPVPSNQDLRVNLGYIHSYASRMNLAAMTPRGDLASSGYCLADPGREFLVYLPTRITPRDSAPTRFAKRWFEGTVTVDLSLVLGAVDIEWFNPTTGKVVAAGKANGGARQKFTAPFDADAVLYLHASEGGSQK